MPITWDGDEKLNPISANDCIAATKHENITIHFHLVSKGTRTNGGIHRNKNTTPAIIYEMHVNIRTSINLHYGVYTIIVDMNRSVYNEWILLFLYRLHKSRSPY